MIKKIFSHVFVILISLQSIAVALDNHPIGKGTQTNNIGVIQNETESLEYSGDLNTDLEHCGQCHFVITLILNNSIVRDIYSDKSDLIEHQANLFSIYYAVKLRPPVA